MLDMKAPPTESPLEKYQTELRSCFPEPEVDLEKLHLKQNLQLNLQDPEAQFRQGWAVQDPDLLDLQRYGSLDPDTQKICELTEMDPK